MNSMMNSEHRQIQIGLTNRYMGNGWLCLFGLYYDEEECERPTASGGERAVIARLLFRSVVIFSLEKLRAGEVETICLVFTSLCGSAGL